MHCHLRLHDAMSLPTENLRMAQTTYWPDSLLTTKLSSAAERFRRFSQAFLEKNPKSYFSIFNWPLLSDEINLVDSHSVTTVREGWQRSRVQH